MRKDVFFKLFIIFDLLIIMAIYHWQVKEKDEQIKILEQQLVEQIQEKEAYIRMLEERNGL